MSIAHEQLRCDELQDNLNTTEEALLAIKSTVDEALHEQSAWDKWMRIIERDIPQDFRYNLYYGKDFTDKIKRRGYIARLWRVGSHHIETLYTDTPAALRDRIVDYVRKVHDEAKGAAIAKATGGEA